MSKKLLLLGGALLCVICSSFAQTSAGTFAISGNVGMSASRYRNDANETKSTTYSFGPSLGYFVRDELMLGAYTDLSIARQNSDNSSWRQTNFGMGPFARYYKFTRNEQFAFFGEFGFGFAFGRNQSNGGDPQKTSTYNMYLSPGFTWFPTPHWGVDLKMNLLSFTSQDPNRDNDGDRYNSVNFGLNLGPYVGIQYFFGNQ